MININYVVGVTADQYQLYDWGAKDIINSAAGGKNIINSMVRNDSMTSTLQFGWI